MPEEKQDPANTQMFRAFVERGEEQQADRSPRTVLLVVAAVVVVALVALIIVFAVS